MLILFDIDMTLLETHHIGIDCLRDAGQELFTPDFTIEGIVFGGGLDPVIIRDMLVMNGIEPSAEHIKSIRTHYHDQLGRIAGERSIARALAGAHDLVNATAGHPSRPAMGLLTGNFPETGTIKVKNAGFDPDLFTINAWGDSSPHAVPHRSHLPPVAIEHYKRINERDLDPSSVVIIGDTEHDVTCAKDNGCRALAVATGHATGGELRDAGADRVLDDLTDTEGIMQWIMDA